LYAHNPGEIMINGARNVGVRRSAPTSNSRASWSRTSPVPSRFEGDRDYLPGDAGEERDAVLGNSRRPLVVCDQCNRTNPAIALYSACANSESQQPVCCAVSPTGSGFAGFGLFSRIIPRGYQSSGQSSTERFSRPAQAPASASCPHRPLSDRWYQAGGLTER
jgi:hypothetical protein